MTNGGPPRDQTSDALLAPACTPSELYLRTFLQTTVDGFWVLDLQGKIVDVNDAYCRMTGYTRQELMQMGIRDLDAEESAEETAARIQRVIRNGSEIFDACHRRKDGGILEVEMSVTYLNAGGGQFVCFCRDVSPRRKIEKALRDSEDKYRAILDNSPLLIAELALKESENNLKEAQKITRLGRWELEIASGRLSWSDTIFDLFEIRKEDFAASYEAFLDFVHPEDRALVDRAYQESVARKQPYELEHRLLMKDGRIKWVNEIGRTDYDDQGRPIRSIGTVQDISERKILLELFSRLSQSNGLEALMAQVMQLMREWSGCDAVGIRLQDGDDFPYYQTQGFPAEFVRHENHLCSRDDRGEVLRDSMGNAVLECMCGNVIRGRFHPALPFFSENGSFWTNSTTQLLALTSESDRQARTRNRCHGEGYESVALIPLRFGEQNLGLLQFNDLRPDRFTESRIALLERLGANLAMGLAHHRTAQALTRSHDLLSNLARLVPGVIYQYRLYPDGRSAFPYASPGIEAIGELSAEQVRDDAAPAFLRLHPDDYDRVVAAIASSARTLQAFYCEFRMVLPRQGLRWRSSQAHPERLPDGSILWHGIISDIDERKQSEDKLAHIHDLMRYIIEHNRSAVAVHDKQMRYIYVSKRYLEEYGVQEQDVIGRHHYEVFPDLPQKWRDVHQRALAGEIVSAEDDPYERADGTVEWTRWECRPWYQADHSVGGIIVYTEVITERKKLEMQLLQAQKMESVGRLAGGVAHDYNNMLSVIMGYTEMALEKVLPDDPLHGDLKEIFKAARRSTDITRQLLAFARKQTIDPKVIDLNEQVESMLRMLRRLIGEEIDLSWHPARQLWPLKMDPSQVTQILANLCVNARDAIDGVGKITIATDCCSFDKAFCTTHRDHAVGEYVRLAVGDNGCGMDQAVLDYIFEPFFTTKDVNEGTGLGLATVYGIVKQNNGFITVQSEPGRGTTFKIYLPRCLDAEQQAQPGTKSAPPATRGETVLLVEDEPAILRMGEMMLKRLGYRVLAAGTPAKALLAAKEQERPIELLITDVVMPEMNGRQLSEQLQALCPGVKTLYMSGHTADVIAHRGVLEEGMNFIQKPFSAKDLGAKVRVLLGQP